MQKQLIISPLIDPPATIIAKKKSVVIDLPATLRANTTYTMNFGNAIADLHEDNSIESFQYVFSTGPVIDSLRITGKAIDARLKKGVKDISVLLYRNIDDSLPLKRKPDYYARTDENGKFNISNIGSGQYMIVALDDKNGNYICDSPQEEAISLNKQVTPDSNEVELDYFNERPANIYIKNLSYTGNKRWRLLMNRSSDSLTYSALAKVHPTYFESWNATHDTSFIWCNDTLVDSLYLQVLNNNIAIDTAKIFLKVVSNFKGKESGNNYFMEAFSAANGLKPLSNPELLFKNPLKNISESKIVLTTDSVPVEKIKITFLDSLKRRLMVSTKWKEGSLYKLKLLPGAVVDFLGNANDTISLSFTAINAELMGILRLTIIKIPNGNLVLQLLNGEAGVIHQVSLNGTGLYEFKTLDPGKYQLRVIEDKNGNGYWDTGNYLLKVAPESMYYFKDEIFIRANWEMEQEWSIE